MARITIEFDNGDQTVIRLGDQSARLAEYAIGRAVQLQGITLTTALKRQREEEAATIAKLRNPHKLPVPYRETEEADKRYDEGMTDRREDVTYYAERLLAALTD